MANCEWTKNVTVVSGIFSVVLDLTVNPFATETGSLKMRVKVDDEEMLPDKIFSAVPYAYRADSAKNVSGAGEIEAAKLIIDGVSYAHVPSGVITMWRGSISDI